MNTNKFVVTVIFEIKPEYLSCFREAIIENAALSLKEESGCLHFDVCEDASQPRVFLYEIYENAAAFDAHLATPHFLHFNAATAEWVHKKSIAKYVVVN